MDPVVVLTTGMIGISVFVIGFGASLARGQRAIRAELRSVSERVTGLDQRLSRLEGAY